MITGDRTAILVIGMHRSGTSAITRTLNLLGAKLPGNILEASPTENPTGFWESQDILDCHERFLAAIGSLWHDPLPLPASAYEGLAADQCRDELVKILRRDFQQTSTFVVKDPRICRLLPLWDKVLSVVDTRPIAVIPFRHPLSVARSLRRRNQFSDAKSLALWLVHMLQAERQSRNWPRLFLRYDDLVEAPTKAAEKMADRLGCFRPEDVQAALPEIKRFWSWDLRHHAIPDTATLPVLIERAYRNLIQAAATATVDTADFDAIGDALSPMLEIYAPLIHDGEARLAELEGWQQKHADLQRNMEHERTAAAAETARLYGSQEEFRQLSERYRQDLEIERAAHDVLRDENGILRADAERGWAELAREREFSATRTAEPSTLRIHVEMLRETRRDIDALREKIELGNAALHQVLFRRTFVSRLGGRAIKLCAEAIYALPSLRGGMFDAARYRRDYPTAGRGWLAPRLHYLLIGRFEGASPNHLFDPKYYLNSYPDVGGAGAEPFLHYLRHGAREGRKPSAGFDGAYYLRQNPDVIRKKVNPLWHYLTYGWREKRDPNAFFDTSFYLEDGTVATEPLGHYLDIGTREGRQPSPAFDGMRYLNDNPDIAAQGLNPLLHYLDYGEAEKRIRPEKQTRPISPKQCGIRILMIAHGRGGGVDRHCDDMETLLAAAGADVWRLESIAEEHYRLRSVTSGCERTYLMEQGAGEEPLLTDLKSVAPTLVHLHHIAGFGTRVWTWIEALHVPYDITLHDYSALCPRVNLLDGRHHYCDLPKNGHDCADCIASAGPHPYLRKAFDEFGDVQKWREMFAVALATARKVFVPDQDTLGRVLPHFPSADILLRPHPEPLAPIPARRPPVGDRIRIAIIGAIGPHKGYHLLKACARAAERDGLPLTFVVIGDVCAPHEIASMTCLEVTGTYRRQDLPSLIEDADCQAAAFFSIWPETFTYTLSEALRAGLYPIAFDIGAIARRIKELGWGTILPLGSMPEHINQTLIETAFDHPLATSEMTVGHNYGSVLKDYYCFQDEHA